MLVSALAACHAERQGHAVTPSPKRTAPPLPASDAPADSAAPPIRPEFATAAPAPSSVETDAGQPTSAPPSALPLPASAKELPTSAQMRSRCRALPKQSECDDIAPRALCSTVVAEFSREAAARALSCYEQLSGGCDGCAIRVCTQDALLGFPHRKLPACDSVRKKVSAASDAAYGDTMFELCEDYASGMNARGVERFASCLKQSIGMGVRICLWDPYVTPCTEGGSVHAPLGDIDD